MSTWVISKSFIHLSISLGTLIVSEKSIEKEELYNDAGDKYEKKRDEVRKRRKEEKQKEFKRT